MDHMEHRFSRESLMKMTRTLIDAYARRDCETLEMIALQSGMGGSDVSRSPGRLFKKLVSAYHPDRLAYWQGKIREYRKSDNREGMERLARFISPASKESEPAAAAMDYSPGRQSYYQPYYHNEAAFGREQDYNDYLDGAPVFESEPEEWGFIEAVKAMMYGNLFAEFLPKDLYYLEGMLDLSSRELEDLKGLSYCVNITGLTMENNMISHLGELEELTHLTSLYLSRNQIEDISPLSKLTGLHTLDLSFNHIEDITPLLHLPDPAYINLLGNPVKNSPRLEELKKRCLFVI